MGSFSSLRYRSGIVIALRPTLGRNQGRAIPSFGRSRITILGSNPAHLRRYALKEYFRASKAPLRNKKRAAATGYRAAEFVRAQICKQDHARSSAAAI